MLRLYVRRHIRSCVRRRPLTCAPLVDNHATVRMVRNDHSCCCRNDAPGPRWPHQALQGPEASREGMAHMRSGGHCRAHAHSAHSLPKAKLAKGARILRTNSSRRCVRGRMLRCEAMTGSGARKHSSHGSTSCARRRSFGHHGRNKIALHLTKVLVPLVNRLNELGFCDTSRLDLRMLRHLAADHRWCQIGMNRVHNVDKFWHAHAHMSRTGLIIMHCCLPISRSGEGRTATTQISALICVEEVEDGLQ